VAARRRLVADAAERVDARREGVPRTRATWVLGDWARLDRAVAEAHGGSVAEEPADGGGTRLTLRLPAVPRRRRSPRRPAPPAGDGRSVRPPAYGAAMPLCFIEPKDAIRVIAESVGREARRQLLGELVRAWVDEIPEEELASHYAKAVADLDEHDLSMLAAWHASLEVGTPIANREFLVSAFPSLGDNRREALKIAAGLRGEDAFNAGVAEEQALETVLPWLSRPRCLELAAECLELYCWDRLGSEN